MELKLFLYLYNLVNVIAWTSASNTSIQLSPTKILNHPSDTITPRFRTLSQTKKQDHYYKAIRNNQNENVRFYNTIKSERRIYQKDGNTNRNNNDNNIDNNRRNKKDDNQDKNNSDKNNNKNGNNKNDNSKDDYQKDNNNDNNIDKNRRNNKNDSQDKNNNDKNNNKNGNNKNDNNKDDKDDNDKNDNSKDDKDDNDKNDKNDNSKDDKDDNDKNDNNKNSNNNDKNKDDEDKDKNDDKDKDGEDQEKEKNQNDSNDNNDKNDEDEKENNNDKDNDNKNNEEEKEEEQNNNEKEEEESSNNNSNDNENKNEEEKEEEQKNIDIEEEESSNNNSNDNENKNKEKEEEQKNNEQEEENANKNGNDSENNNEEEKQEEEQNNDNENEEEEKENGNNNSDTEEKEKNNDNSTENTDGDNEGDENTSSDSESSGKSDNEEESNIEDGSTKDNDEVTEETSNPTKSPTLSPTSLVKTNDPTSALVLSTNSPTVELTLEPTTSSPTLEPTTSSPTSDNPTLASTTSDKQIVIPLSPFELNFLTYTETLNEDLFLNAVKSHLQYEFEYSLPEDAILQNVSLSYITRRRKLLNDITEEVNEIMDVSSSSETELVENRSKQLFLQKYSFYGSATFIASTTTHFDYLKLPLGATLRAFNEQGLNDFTQYLKQDLIVNVATMKFNLISSANTQQETATSSQEINITSDDSTEKYKLLADITKVTIAAVCIFVFLCTYFIFSRFCMRKRKDDKINTSTEMAERSKNVHSDFKDDTSLFPSINIGSQAKHQSLKRDKSESTQSTGSADEIIGQFLSVDDLGEDCSSGDSSNDYTLPQSRSVEHGTEEIQIPDEESCNESWLGQSRGGTDHDNYSQISFSDYYNDRSQMGATTTSSITDPMCITSWEANIKRETIAINSGDTTKTFTSLTEKSAQNDKCQNSSKSKFLNTKENTSETSQGKEPELFPTFEQLW